MRIENPTDQECKTLIEFNWVVALCSIAKLHNKADYLVFKTAKEAIYAHRGCIDCQVYAPQDEATLKETLR
jgi:hypothetical protein